MEHKYVRGTNVMEKDRAQLVESGTGTQETMSGGEWEQRETGEDGLEGIR